MMVNNNDVALHVSGRTPHFSENFPTRYTPTSSPTLPKIVMTPHPSEKIFKPRQTVSKQHSPNAKTTRNRNAERSKRGLEAAFLKADIAFRTAKSRALAKLHKSNEWGTLSDRQKSEAITKAVRMLEDKRDKRKRGHELEWRYKMDEGLVDSDEEPMQEVNCVDGDVSSDRPAKRQKMEETVVDDDGDTEWEDCEGQEDWEQIGTDLLEIRRKYERRHQLMVTTIGARAARREKEYHQYRDRMRMKKEIELA
jgi:hypothetical protein